jgi:subtilisin family serine protease
MKLAITLALAGLILGAAPVLASNGSPGVRPTAGYTGKVENRVFADTAGGDQTSFIIELTQQADLSGAYTMKDQDARGWYVYRTLEREAERTQGPIKAMLDAQNVSYRSFWVANEIVVHSGGRALVNSLAERPDVKVIESNAASNWLESDVAVAFDSLAILGADRPDTVEPGVAQVHGPDLWNLGFTGTGIVIGNQDTGMRWTHNALKPHYRGWNGASADHNYNWHDAIHADINGNGTNPCGFNAMAPCDDNAHGTHTTGTTSGDDGAGNQIGAAPGAKWIGCRNMDEGVGRPETYTECFQFFIAPTDLNNQSPNPALRPHVMNNSWGCPPSELCAANSLQQIVENTQAAGIFVEVSAGNAGPNCSTVSDPPAIYNASYSTGALLTGTNQVVGFSSRGPVTVDGSNRVKPDIVAPGAVVRSSTNATDSSYASFQGTSMAGPHVVGVVALLWQAIPSLNRDIAATMARLNSTANPNITVSNGTSCGGVDHVPNNHFGYGLVDALAAFNAGGPPPPSPPPPPPPSPPPPPPPRPPPTRCIVPRVLGLRLGAAKRKIRRRHCSVGRVRRAHSRRPLRGRVIGQSPRPAAGRRQGFPVRLVVGRA